VADDSDLERTEAPSSRRIEKAREEGQVPQSRELVGFLIMASGTAAFWIMSGWFGDHAAGIMRRGLSFNRATAFDGGGMTELLAALSVEAATMLAPLFILLIAVTMATPFTLGGWLFSPKAMSFNPARLNPMQGISRMFSMHGLGELVKAVLKAALIGGVVSWVIWQRQDELLALMAQPLETGLNSFLHLIFVAALALLLGMAVIAAIDVPFQLWVYYKSLRMTREELKQENKELEGDPRVKSRIRSQQRELARRRMMEEVPKADVVVTNPTHYAVALKYDGSRMAAPQVVAKGMNLVAERIREIAAEHRVPLLEAPPLARALHRHADVGDQIPAPLYAAVAQVLAYVYQLNAATAANAPSPPTDLPVPAELDPGVVA
jgi:flagellar biosynthetic protein FlhB